MKKLYNEILLLIGKSNFTYLIFLSISLIFLSLLEFIGIGSIPVFLSVIIDPNILLDHINSPFIFNIINENEKSDLILFSSVFLILVFLTKNLIYVLIIYFQGILTKRVKLYLSSKIYKKYLDSNYLDFINKNSAMMIRTLNMDVGNTSIFVLNIINLMRETTIFIAICTLLFIASPVISITMLIFFGIISLLFFLKTHKKIFSQGLSLQFLTSDKIKIIYNTIGSIKEVKILKLENFLKKKFFENVKEFEKFAFKNYFVKLMPRVLLEISAVSSIIAIVIIYVILEKNILGLLPLLSLIVVSMIRIVPGLNLIQNSLSTLKTILPSYNHVLSELLRDSEKFENSKLNKNKKNISFNKDILISDLEFQYEKNSIPVLDKINIKISKGDKIGIIGKSGSGKTTLVSILLGLIENYKGKLIIDGKEINFLDYEWNNIIGYVPQDIFLIEDTIKNNITFGINEKNIDNSFLNDAAKKAQIFDYIETLPKKFDTIVGERGLNLSAGQKQRLGIARALYRKPELLILDESTSSLDFDTEEKFINDVFNYSDDKTIIFISHKATALKKCHKIFDLNKKKFVQ